MRLLHRIEDISVRIMYVFNVTDTFLPLSVAMFLVIGAPGIHGCAQFGTNGAGPAVTAFYFVYVYLCFRIADFHVLYLAAAPFVFILVALISPGLSAEIGSTAAVMLAGTVLIQVIFMGIPMGAASRSLWVPLKMLLHSFVIIAPTTISLPVTLGFQMMMIFSVKALAHGMNSGWNYALAAILLGGAVCTRMTVARPRRYGTYHPPPPPPLYRRVVVLNIDGLSHHAFSRANAPFLKHLAAQFASAEQGAETVYKAFTNPAFASILTGRAPHEHRVVNNNLGQHIRGEALPDFIDTRLYGSMHVRHFSRPRWNVSIVSLVELGYREADRVLMQTMKNDMETNPGTELWIADLSRVDYSGHAWGGYSREYYEGITKIDGIVKDFFQWCQGAGLSDDTLFIISSDHGLFIGEHAYMLSRKEKYVPLVFVGSTIAPTSLPADVSIVDIAANVSYFLGKRYGEGSRGRVFENINIAETEKGFACRLDL